VTALAASSFGALLAFVLLALPRAEGAAGAFAACAGSLALAAAFGPFLYEPRRRGLVQCAALGAMGGAVAATVALARGGPVATAAAAGLFCGLYAAALGTVAHLAGLLLGARLARALAACAGIALLGTLFYWDDLFLHRAASRKASAAAALAWNPAAAAATTLGYDWIHAKALYTGNETAESLLGVRRPRLGALALRLFAVGAAAAGGAALLERARRRWS
jgi:hypothetical protein